MVQIDTASSNTCRGLHGPLLWLAALLLSSTAPLDAQWVDISPAQTEYPDLFFFGGAFYSDDLGIAVGQDLSSSRGVIARTADGGQSWELHDYNNEDLRGAGFFSGQSVLVMGYDGPLRTKTVLHNSTNGGMDWSAAEVPQVRGAEELEVVSPTAAWALGYGPTGGISGGLLRTVDGGSTWTLPLAMEGFRFVGLSALDENTAFVAATDYDIGALLTTLDGGNTWTQYNFAEWPEDVHFLDRNTGFVLAGGTLLRTADGGANWNSVAIDGDVNRIWFTSESIGYAVGENGLARKTADAGATWVDLQIDTDLTLLQLSRQGDYLYAFGIFSSAFRLDISGTSTSVDDEVVNADAVLNMSLAPMPAASTGVLKYTLQSATRRSVNIDLTDVNGHRVRTFVDRVHEPGDHTLMLDLKGCPAGVWFITATVNGRQSVLPLTIHR